MTVKRRRKLIFVAEGVEEEERRGQVTDKPQKRFIETDLFLPVQYRGTSQPRNPLRTPGQLSY